jgi:type VI secretion system protein ImpJ
MQVTLEPSWVEEGNRLYIGVRSTLPAEECVYLLTRPGRLDMKVGSSDQVDAIYRLGRAGLHLRHDPTPPRIMPAPPDTVFFRVEPGRTPPEWLAVQRSLTLAIRVNERLLADDVPGRQELTIRADAQEARMRFVLYVVPNLEGPLASTPTTRE